jgi:O-antigen ligase
MTAAHTAGPLVRAKMRMEPRRHGIRILQVFVVALFAIPSTYVVKAVGAVGYAAGLVGMFAFIVWLVAIILGHHEFGRYRNPIRAVLCVFWIVTLLSYIFMNRGLLNTLQLNSANRWLMQMASMTGVAFLGAECLHSVVDFQRVLRVLSWAGAFCGVVALLQWRFSIDITPYLGKIPGFTVDGTGQFLISRSGENRVAGTGVDPIELGVTACMLLPLGIWAASQTRGVSPMRRWTPVALTALAIPASVSRSAVIGIVLSLGLFIVLMPPRQRVTAFILIPIGIAAVFMISHGELGTLTGYLGYGASGADPSVAHRTNNYPYVGHLVAQAPWLGWGGGTYLPDVVHILDNQWLDIAIDLGFIGVFAFAVLFIVPLVTALKARAKSGDEALRLLCAALASGFLTAGVCSAFFDSFSFPLFYNVLALELGLAGACWRLAGSESKRQQRQSNPLQSGIRQFAARRFVRLQGEKLWT